MNDFINNILKIQFEIQFLFIVGFIFILINCVLLISNIKKTNKLKTKYARFMNGLSDRNMEELLDTCLTNINNVSAKNKDIEVKINDIERNLIQCIQKVGIIRFNAFDNVGSDLSFAIALLDNNDTGIVISGIYARDSSSTYAKPIISGKSKYSLSAEEIQAIDIAKKTNIERNYTNL
ncbi:DUF4446 family protein [Ruminiclostridium herbifermentans]|uniref:DUF4446 family protein n=1 Tax=Ruminiclostridium herbifermentans TaxID=2488810 RepID=A0A4U7JGA0_9FIRM|nr:DUF4446 family protein [Ruminiclostridium herbifermentans]QNU66990.1 DUF4446 family protein [Ruminiclostridium herbifermentans]